MGTFKRALLILAVTLTGLLGSEALAGPLSASLSAPLSPRDLWHGCRDYFARLWGPKEVRGYVKLKSGREMYYVQRKAPPGRPSILALHGLGDSHVDWERHAAYWEKKGFGVVRPDLHGFGMTRTRSLEGNPAIPDAIPYQYSVEDVAELVVEHLGLREVGFAAHSYGAAIARNVITRIRPQLDFVTLSEFPPYVVRLDSYAQHSMLTGDYFLDELKKTLHAVGVSEENASHIVDPYFDVTRLISDSVLPFDQGITAVAELDAHLDPFLAPILDEFMAGYYPRYFLRKMGKGDARIPIGSQKLTPAERESIERDVAFSIAATKGVRGENAFAADYRFPADVHDQLVIAGRDSLDPRNLLSRYHDRLRALGVDVKLIDLPEAGHLYPVEHPEEAAELVADHVEMEWAQYRHDKKLKSSRK